MSRFMAAQRTTKLLPSQTHLPILSIPSSAKKNQNYYLRRRRKWQLPYNDHRENFNQQAAMRSLKESPTTHLLDCLIESFALYNCDPTPAAYRFVIKILTKTSQCHQLPAVLDRIEKNENFETPESIFVYLIRFYGRKNKLQEAIEVFFRIPNFRCIPSVDSLHCLLSVLCKKKAGLEIVPQILVKSRLMNVRFDESSFSVFIESLCRAKKGENAVKLVHHMAENDIRIDRESFSLILSTLCEQKGLSCAEVMGFLEEMMKFGFCPGRTDWENVIRFLVRNGKCMYALEALNQMKCNGIKPSVVCYTMVLYGVICEGDYDKADEVFDEMLVLGLVPDIFTYNVYVNGLCKQNKLDAGVKMLAYMEEMGCKPNLVTYNTLLRATCELNKLSMAREVLRHMRVKAVQVSLQSYEIMICGLASKGDVFEARGLLKGIVSNCLIPRSTTLDKVICGLCQKGLFVDALELLKEMVGKNLVPGAKSWEALIAGFEFKHSFEDNALIDL